MHHGIKVAQGNMRAGLSVDDTTALDGHEQSDDARRLQTQFQGIGRAIGAVLKPKLFRLPLQAPQSTVIRDAPIVVQTIHNPSLIDVTVTLTLDQTGDLMQAQVNHLLHAGDVLTNLGLEFPRLYGFVTSANNAGWVIIGGELPVLD